MLEDWGGVTSRESKKQLKKKSGEALDVEIQKVPYVDPTKIIIEDANVIQII